MWYVMCERYVAERRIAAGNRIIGGLAALIRRRNFSMAACLAVHNVVLVSTLLYRSEM